MFGILNLHDLNNPIDPKSLFGQDVNRLAKACNFAMECWLHPYNGCYKSTERPTFHDVKMPIPAGSNIMNEYRSLLNDWYEHNPVEKAKEEESRKLWEAELSRQFRIIYGIAKRHHLRLVWHGKGAVSCGDQWEIYKNGDSIGRILCM